MPPSLSIQRSPQIELAAVGERRSHPGDSRWLNRMSVGKWPSGVRLRLLGGVRHQASP
jgi:hypothetical protein